ncbi:MAG: cation-translocating P-type ATPase [Deltaproteobacteria bacterium]|nr:cation-translocating P-type ATPase [Deltaproteobacteria bacterium]
MSDAARSSIDDPTAGLSDSEAAHRLAADGPNEIAHAPPPSVWVLLLGQFKSPLVLLLLGASALSAALGEIADAIAIAAIIIINAIVGFMQEYRAERAVQALRSMTAPRARVLRNGAVAVIPSAQIVRGDVLLLEAGDVIAADGRLLEAHNLLTNEAPLTGESMPVEKAAGESRETDARGPIDRPSTVFMGTAVVGGVARALVEATGMRTELGKIAHLLATTTDEATPLQRRLARVSQMLLYACLGIVVLVALLGLLHQRAWLDVLISAVSLAVAAVPEGLPAIVTIALALGVQRMASRHVLVRKLPAVETLGSATVICTDKTGTLTTGVMRVRELWGDDHLRLLDAAAACCDAELSADEHGGTGDPTELAILIAGAERSIRRANIERDRPRVAENPFDAERKRMSIQRQDGVLYVKGAVERVLDKCERDVPLARTANAQMAERGLRVLAVATGTGANEDGLTLVGLVGIADPPRTEAIAAVKEARAAGVKTVMITGDHPITAQAIARELGILTPSDTASEVVHARATPEQKLDIVRRWKERGAIVAMTGDGVNDAPALREANIGIAMGTGTEVTREASDVILTDDNFASIVAGVREGRGIFENIRKTLVYLLTGNAAELAIMLIAAAVGLPTPLLPLHLLWINLVTDGLPALALVSDPVNDELMQTPPRPPNEPMLGKKQWLAIALTGSLEAALVLGVFFWALGARDLQQARSLAFFVLVFSEVLRAFAARSPTKLLWEVGAFTNLRLLAVVAVTASLQVAVQQLPITQRLFGIEALAWSDGLMALGLAFVPVSVLELLKLGRRAWSHR